ncbi:hypothetical protein DPMN_127584 [Dreissena polymorpha]|uniref:Uncharacterized protein n=1 Tax=Dreissena polymorpha TaxID=45954 RepID=A0A9D4H1I2_DREPO|nr:hypothetical protein DPMN_127584 [Dreissena polymorpha]
MGVGGRGGLHHLHGEKESRLPPSTWRESRVTPSTLGIEESCTFYRGERRFAPCTLGRGTPSTGKESRVTPSTLGIEDCCTNFGGRGELHYLRGGGGDCIMYNVKGRAAPSPGEGTGATRGERRGLHHIQR